MKKKFNRGRWIVESVVALLKETKRTEMDPLRTVCCLIARGWESKSIKTNLQDAIDNVREAIRTQGADVGLEPYANDRGSFQLKK